MIFSAYRQRTAVFSLLALVPILVIVGPYSIPYAQSRATYGPRSAAEVERYSAVPTDFLRVPPENRLRGEHNGEPAPDERSLFPGAIALAVAITALWPPVSRAAALYAVLALFAFDASLGTHGFSFSVLQWLAPPVTSLRAPARFAALFLLSLALLAALAAARWNKASGGRATAWTLVAAVLCVGEYWSAPLPVRLFETKPSAAHQWLAMQPADTVVLELPMPTLTTLWLYETTFQVRSIHHWKRLVNGYSGFVPAEYGKTVTLMQSFPDARSVNRLRALSVDVVLLNRGLFSEPAYDQLRSALRNSPDFLPPLMFGNGPGEILAFRLSAAP